MKKILSSGLAIGAMISLVGCGGGSSSSTSMDAGYFVDTNVAGLNYTCSSGKTDITSNKGQYSCPTGDTVKFSLGSYSLGGEVAASSGIVGPDTLWPNNPDAALNVAQLIQTVTTTDADGNLVVPENFTDLDDSTVEINSTNFDSEIVADLTDYSELVSEADAQAHLDDSAVLLFIAGNTFYLFDQGMERLEFSADGTSVTITDLVDSTNDTMSISIDGDTITAEDGTTVKVYLQESLISFDNAIIVDVTEDQVTTEERWYLDQEDRLRDLLANNTWESTDVTVTFNADVTSATVVETDGEFTDTVTLDGMELTHADGTDVIRIENPEMLIFNPGMPDQEMFTLVTTSTQP